MKWGYFDERGDLLAIAELPAGIAPLDHAAEFFCLPVPDDASASSIWLDAASQAVISREPASLALDRGMILAGGKDTAWLSGPPAGARLRIASEERVMPAGRLAITRGEPGLVYIELLGRHTGDHALIEVITPVEAARRVRAERDAKLAATDFAEFASWRATKSAKALAAWDAYRQSLRDVPQTQPGALPDAVAWPPPPGEPQ